MKKTRWIFDLNEWKTNTSLDAKKWVNNQFPKKHYGNEILESVYEGWDLRAFLEQAYMAGKESSTNKRKKKEL